MFGRNKQDDNKVHFLINMGHSTQHLQNTKARAKKKRFVNANKNGEHLLHQTLTEGSCNEITEKEGK